MIKDILAVNETVKPNSKEIDVLHNYFPQCFNNVGQFDLEKFQSLIKEKVDITNEGYDLNFLGKNYAKLLASIDTTTIIYPDLKENNQPENINSQNVYISGDNLDGLKHLLKSYAGQVKCIYIDPPYNTGGDGFVYKDKFNFTPEDLSLKLSIGEEQAEKILNLTRRGSASHSAWLMFMYSRLELARDLLSEDGVIFISIDDNEQANLKLLCDSIFGEENLISQIIIQSNKRGQTYKQIAKTHEYLLTYVRNENSIINELKREIQGNTKTDLIGEYSERELRNRNPKYGRFNRPNLFYPIFINPNTIDENGYSPATLENGIGFIEVLPLNSEDGESCWRWGKTKFLKNIGDSTMNSNVVGRIKNTGEYGIYEKYRKKTYKAKTIWFDNIIFSDDDDDNETIWDETGVITEQGSAELRKYGMGDVFEFPKPTHLVKKALELGSNRDSICVDFFSGSGTLAESVLALNAMGSQRKFISIQLPEDLDFKLKNASSSDKPKVQNAINFLDQIGKPHTLDQIGIERIKRAAKKIKEETGADIDYGFKHYTLKEPTANTLDRMERFDPQAILADENIVQQFGKSAVLQTWLVRDGYGFGPCVQEITLHGYKAHHSKKHLYFIDTNLSEKDIIVLIDRYNKDEQFNPENIVIFGYSFTFTQTEMLRKNLAILKDGHKNLKINIDVRY